MAGSGRSDAACRSCSEAKLDLRVRARGDGGITVTLGRVLPESVVFTLALLAFKMAELLNKDGGAGLEIWTGSGVDGLGWRDDKSLARGDSSEWPLRSRLGVIGDALTSRERKLGAISRLPD